MRRFLSTSFIVLTLVISAAGAAPVAHAATCAPGYLKAMDGTFGDANGVCTPDASSGTPADTTTTTNTDCLASSLHDANGNCIGDGAATPGGAAAANTPTPLPQNPDNSAAMSGVMAWIMSLFAWLVGVAAITLDNAVYYTVVTMGTYVSKLSAIGVTWRILRDIGNILLIFGFLAVGITTILNVDWYGGGKKMLPMMLVAAVFLNFSLFISEAIIDTGNLFATQFYTQINGGTPAGTKSFDSGFSLRTSNEGISDKIMSQLGLQSIYNGARTNTEVFKAGNSWIIGFMGIILFIITAFVMFSLAFILIARFVILIFLIILAPVGFAGLAVPQLAKRANQWWEKLFEQTVTAPILMLMLYIALAVITDAQFLTGFGVSKNPDAWFGFLKATGFDNLPGFAGVILSFLVAMGLLILVVIQSKNLSAFGAKQAMGIASWPGRVAARYATGYAGLGLQRLNSKIRSTRTGRALGRVASVATLGALSDFEVNKATGQMQQAKFGTSSSVADRRTFAEKRTVELSLKAESDKNKKELNEALITGNSDKAAEILQRMSNQQLDELALNKKSAADLELIAKSLSPSQFEYLFEKSTKYTEGDKRNIQNARYRSVSKEVAAVAAGGSDAGLKTVLRGMTTKELEAMPSTMLTDSSVLGALSGGQREELGKSNNISPVVKTELKKRDPVEIIKTLAAAGNVAGAAAEFTARKLNDKQVAKLPGSVLSQPLIMAQLLPRHLGQIQREGSLEPAEVTAIGAEMQRIATTNASMKKYLDGPAGTYWL